MNWMVCDLRGGLHAHSFLHGWPRVTFSPTQSANSMLKPMVPNDLDTLLCAMTDGNSPRRFATSQEAHPMAGRTDDLVRKIPEIPK
jgi:hypothetical protein